ncbi:MAG TPA: CRTAC1 family protein [Vicinamibacterales bacterium]|nr:CRTAC1 family protein [Vicinamibacterales bacterium]
MLCALMASACGSKPTPATQSEWFSDVAQQAGLHFTHFNGMSGHYYYPEIMAPGVALFDYNNDGLLDIYVTQGQPLGDDPTMLAGARARGPLKDHLFRNDGHLHFTDVTEQSGINLQTYGMGVAVGDYDNDGFLDIYRTSLSGAVLLRNNGNGTFTDVTKDAGVGDPGGWGVSATFFDYDRDGRLDLFVGNYLIYSLAGDIQCQSVTGRRDYCPPNSYRAQPSHLYHNAGNGRFEDVTARALTGGAYGPALGAVAADFNNDGWIDLYVANDSAPNQLWINQRNGTFKDTAFLAGAAVGGTGEAEASMAVDAGDIDNDGDEDLIVTNWLDQMNVLYVNDGMGNFEDRRGPSGLGAPSLAKTGFGAGWLDVDRDGWLDLFVANGGVATIEALARAHDPFPLKMTPQLYRNAGSGRFEDVSSRAGAVFRIADVGRGVAFGDVDNDGRPDVVVANDNGALRLLVNKVENGNHWIGLKLAVNARVQIVREGQPTLWRRARADGSYASSSDPRILAGLGPSDTPPRVAVTWPDGTVETFTNVPIDRYSTLVEGSGTK